jgi:hypothetical protein
MMRFAEPGIGVSATHVSEWHLPFGKQTALPNESCFLAKPFSRMPVPL